MKRIIYILTTFLIFNQSFAGNEGGGGDVIVCYDSKGKIKDMESLDVWVGKTELGLKLPRLPLGENDLSIEERPYMDQVKEVFDRLKKLDPIMGKKFYLDAQMFSPDSIQNEENIAIVPKLHDNGDGAQKVFPNASQTSCSKIVRERLVWQNDKPKTFQSPYEIVEHLWNLAPESVKASVIQHEVILRTDRKYFSPTNSRDSQYYNAVISSEEFDQIDVLEYLKILIDQKNDGGRPWNENGPFSVYYRGIIFKTDGLRILDEVFGHQGYSPIDQMINIVVEGEVYPIKIMKGAWLKFSDEGHLIYVNKVKNEMPIYIHGSPMYISKIELFKNTFLKSAVLAKSSILDLPPGHQPSTITLESHNEVSFYTNGGLRAATPRIAPGNVLELKMDYDSKTVIPLYRTVTSQNTIEFDFEGRLKKAYARFCSSKHQEIEFKNKKVKNLKGEYFIEFDYRSMTKPLVVSQWYEYCQ